MTRKPGEQRLSTDLYVPPPPPGPDLRPRNTALIGGAAVLVLAGRRQPRPSRLPQEDVVKARAVGVRARRCPRWSPPRSIALAAFVALPPDRFGWWPAAAITAAAVLLLVVTVYRRNAPGWVAALVRWRPPPPAPPSTRRPRRWTSPHGNIVCGVRVDEYEAITMVQTHRRPYAPTFLRGSTVSLTTNVVPLDVLAGLLDQPGGLKLAGIDMVSSGQRVRRGTGHTRRCIPRCWPTGPPPGRRNTQLIVRLDITDSVPGLAYRKSIGAAAAAATERIINALLQARHSGHRPDRRRAGRRARRAGRRAGCRHRSGPPNPRARTATATRADAGAPTRRHGSPRRRAPGSRRVAAAKVGWRTVNARPGI